MFGSSPSDPILLWSRLKVLHLQCLGDSRGTFTFHILSLSQTLSSVYSLNDPILPQPSPYYSLHRCTGEGRESFSQTGFDFREPKEEAGSLEYAVQMTTTMASDSSRTTPMPTNIEKR